MPPLNLQVQANFAKEFVQKLNILNISNPTLDHVNLFYKVPWVVGFRVLRLRGCYQGVQQTCEVVCCFHLLCNGFFPFVYPPHKKNKKNKKLNQQQQLGK
jgi:hypothetical protein